MGAEPYSYFVEYQSDVQKALEELWVREFQAGRDFRFAQDAASADGMRSILDIASVGEERGYSIAAPIDDEALEELYGTTRPTRQMVESCMDFLADVDRGQCVYIITYKNDRPDGILFAGYTFD